jgi:hypothetical protein
MAHTSASTHPRPSDPLLLVTSTRHTVEPESVTTADAPLQKAERLAREKSIKNNRRRKFVNSLTSTEVEICERPIPILDEHYC